MVTSVSGSALVVDDGIRFELDQPVRINETRDLHDRVGGANIAKELTVYCGDSLPVLDASQQSSGADHMPQGRSGLIERGGDDLQTTSSLNGWIPLPDGLPVGP